MGTWFLEFGKKMFKRLAITIFIVASTGIALSLWADDDTVKVVGIVDGDTIHVLENKKEIKVRLAEIDAPERKQPYGTKAKQVLSNKIFGKNVTVSGTKIDRYGRKIGTIFCNNRNINLEMVKEGLAWQYKTYSKSKEYADAELQARQQHLGLWNDKNPIPPWEWRKKY